MHELASKTLFIDELSKFTSRMINNRAWVVNSIEYPVLDISFTDNVRQGIRLRMDCSDWNEKPPSIKLLGLDGSILRSLPPNPTGVFNAGKHPQTGLPFICMRGSREYHNHSSHISDHWDKYRKQQDNNLGGILTQLWHAWLKGEG